MGTYIAQVLLLWTRVIDLERERPFKVGKLALEMRAQSAGSPSEESLLPRSLCGEPRASSQPKRFLNFICMWVRFPSCGRRVSKTFPAWMESPCSHCCTNLINLIAHFCLLCSGVGLRVVAKSLNSVLMARDLPFPQKLLFAAPQCSWFSVSPVWCPQDAPSGHNLFPLSPGMWRGAGWAGADRGSWGQWLQCHCSNSSPNLGIFSFPAAKATRDFLPWKCGVCAALLTPGLQRKARISLGNNCFRALWCNKAWIKADGCLVWVGVRNNQFCVLEGEGKADTEIQALKFQHWVQTS